MLTLDAHYNTKHYTLKDMGKSYWSIFQVSKENETNHLKREHARTLYSHINKMLGTIITWSIYIDLVGNYEWHNLKPLKNSHAPQCLYMFPCFSTPTN
jgi:hypothetical protein